MGEFMEPAIKKSNSSKDEVYLGVGGFIFEVIKIILLAFIVIVPVRVFLFQPFFVQGSSMQPNFEDGQYLIINELGYKRIPVGREGLALTTVEPYKKIERQKAIVFRYPLDPQKYFIKRVVGLPGEKVEVKNGKVKIYNDENPDGFVLDESFYLSEGVKTVGEVSLMLEDNEYFVLGDNRQFSSDSRAWGPLEKKYVIGTVLLRAWPLDEVSVF
jgi:signal peptidase I